MDPAPGEGYSFSVSIICPNPAYQIKLSVVGTDGYTADTRFPLYTGQSSFYLYVPGAKANVVDTVNAQMLDENLQPVGNIIEKIVVFYQAAGKQELPEEVSQKGKVGECLVCNYLF